MQNEGKEVLPRKKVDVLYLCPHRTLYYLAPPVRHRYLSICNTLPIEIPQTRVFKANVTKIDVVDALDAKNSRHFADVSGAAGLTNEKLKHPCHIASAVGV